MTAMIKWAFGLSAASAWIEVQRGHLFLISTLTFSPQSRLRYLNAGLPMH